MNISAILPVGKAIEMPMTHLLNTLLADALVRLEHGVENVSDAHVG